MAPPVIPVVPRMFERKKKTSPANLPAEAHTAVNGADPSTQTPKVHDRATATPSAPETSDWASLAANESLLESVAPNAEDSKGSAVCEAPMAGVPENGHINGYHEIHSPGQAAPNGQYQQIYPFVPQINGNKSVMPRSFAHAHDFPPGLAPFHHRGGSQIAFGSFGELNGSEGSSPTLPPSATSTHFTQPTPMSDTPSQGSRAGYGNGVVEHAIPRPPFSQNHPHQIKTVNRRYDNPELLHAVSVFKERNRDNLLASIQQDVFVGGVSELNLMVSTADGKDNIKIWRAICRRSPDLSRLLDQAVAENPHAELHSRSAFITLESVRSVIQSLYGCPLVPTDFVDSGINMAIRRPLEWIATGYLLGAVLVLDYGTQLAMKMLYWESLAIVFQFCLEDSQLESGDGRSEDLVDLPHIVHQPRPHVVDLLAQSLDCIIREINGDDGFKFDDNAAYLVELGGGFHARPVSVSLPTFTPGPVPGPAHGSSQIQFGNMGNLYRLKHQTLSSILLSLPLIVLQHVLSHVYNRGIVEDVVREREKRRAFAVKGGSTSCHARYEERVISTREFNGMRVISTRVL